MCSLSKYNLILQESKTVPKQKSDKSDSNFWGSSGTIAGGSDSTSTPVTKPVTSTDSGVSSGLRDNMEALSVREKVSAINAKDGKPDSGAGKSHLSSFVNVCLLPFPEK